MAKPADSRQMQAAWLRLMAALAVDEQGAQVAFAQLAQRYAEPHRAYHTLAHAWQVVQHVERLAAAARDLPSLQAAAWLHDVVYDPRQPDNETRSADFAAGLLSPLGLAPALVARVQELIRLTAHHAPPSDDDAQLLLDADLAILGAPQAEYARYAAAIRREFAWVEEAAYRAGRAAILRQFLQRPVIYHTPAMRREREQQARDNLQREIDRLAAAPTK